MTEQTTPQQSPGLATCRPADIAATASSALLGYPVTRAIRAILVIDIVESVRLIEQDEDGVIARWLSLVEHVETDLLPAGKGRLVKCLGDGMLLEFGEARQAASVAFAIQHASRRQNFGLPPERQMLLRMGIEISDVIVESRDVYGHGVNLATRLAGLAGPGEIVVSARVRDQLTPFLDADVEDLGECFLKHVREPVRAYRIGPPGPRPVIETGILAEELRPTLAVIPFTTRGAATDHYVLGEVLAEEMIREVSCSPDLNVISRLSTSAFRWRQVSLAEINAHLNTDYVLSGIYHVDGGRIRLDVELAEAKSAHIIYARRFEDHIAGVLGGKQGLADQVVKDVRGAIMSREQKRAESQSLPTLRGYTLLLGAVALLHRNSRVDFVRSQEMLQTLIDRWPRRSIPQAWMAKWHVFRTYQGWSDDPEWDARQALSRAERALDADPQSSLALSINGLVHTHMSKRLDIAQERYELAVQVNPNDSLAWLLKGTLQAFIGNGKMAVDNTQRAMKLSPIDPHRYYYESLAATAFLADHQFENAVSLAEQSVHTNKMHTSTLRALAIAQWQLGRHEDARATVRRLLKLDPGLTITRYLERTPAAAYDTGREWSKALRLAGVPS
jgi:adenylate cyclase